MLQASSAAAAGVGKAGPVSREMGRRDPLVGRMVRSGATPVLCQLALGAVKLPHPSRTGAKALMGGLGARLGVCSWPLDARPVSPCSCCRWDAKPLGGGHLTRE